MGISDGIVDQLLSLVELINNDLKVKLRLLMIKIK